MTWLAYLFLQRAKSDSRKKWLDLRTTVFQDHSPIKLQTIFVTVFFFWETELTLMSRLPTLPFPLLEGRGKTCVSTFLTPPPPHTHTKHVVLSQVSITLLGFGTHLRNRSLLSSVFHCARRATATVVSPHYTDVRPFHQVGFLLSSVGTLCKDAMLLWRPDAS